MSSCSLPLIAIAYWFLAILESQSVLIWDPFSCKSRVDGIFYSAIWNMCCMLSHFLIFIPPCALNSRGDSFAFGPWHGPKGLIVPVQVLHRNRETLMCSKSYGQKDHLQSDPASAAHLGSAWKFDHMIYGCVTHCDWKWRFSRRFCGLSRKSNNRHHSVDMMRPLMHWHRPYMKLNLWHSNCFRAVTCPIHTGHTFCAF